MKSIEDQVYDVIREQLGISRDMEITPDTLLGMVPEGLGADSLDMVELVMELEEEFDINLPDEVWENATVVGDMIRVVKERCPEDGVEEEAPVE